MASLERAIAGAQRRYHESVKHLESVMRSRGEVVSIEKVISIKREIMPLGAFILSLESNIAGRLSEGARAEFAGAFDAVAPVWNEEIERKNIYINELLTC